jgi:polyhydroxyalkanoate synthesis regulator phasin
MNRTKKLLLAAAAAAVVAVAVGASGAIAVSRVLDDDASEEVIEDAADQLGVEPQALADALKQALQNRVDEAVESGRLTEEQGERLKELIESGDVPFLGGFGLRGLGGFGPGHFGPFASLDTAASYLDVTEAELRERLRDGETLAEIARDEGKSVDGLVDALVDAAKARIDEAVDEGRLDEERADELRDGLRARLQELVNDELARRGDGPRFGGHFGVDPEFRFRGGPRLDSAPRA